MLYIIEILKFLVCLSIVIIVYKNIFVSEIKNKFYKAKDSKIYLSVSHIVYEFASNYNLKIVKMSTFIIFSLIVFFISYIFFYSIFYSPVPSFLMATFIAIIPYNIFVYMIKRRKKNILKIFPTFALGLKNYTDVDNNIIYAFSNVEANLLIKPYIERFNVSTSRNVDVCSAFETLKKDINIEEVSNFITLLENCYLNGGNFSKVIEKYSKMQSKINIEKEKINENLYASKLILIVLIILSLLLLFGFALKNNDYSSVLLYTFGGKVVLSFNILTYFFMYLIYLKICKMEE